MGLGKVLKAHDRFPSSPVESDDKIPVEWSDHKDTDDDVEFDGEINS